MTETKNSQPLFPDASTISTVLYALSLMADQLKIHPIFASTSPSFANYGLEPFLNIKMSSTKKLSNCFTPTWPSLKVMIPLFNLLFLELKSSSISNIYVRFLNILMNVIDAI